MIVSMVLLAAWFSAAGGVEASPVQERPAELVLDLALPVEGLEKAEPSGLALCNGVLYTVSDNHDAFIYRVRIDGDRAVLEPAIPVAVPDGVRADFEGIVCDDAGTFFLASEVQFRVLRVSADGKDCAWVTPSLKAEGERAGLFKFRGGYFEGLARIDATHFVLCAERQPRGLVYVDQSTDAPRIECFEVNGPTVQPRGIRFPDFTDLCWHENTLYVLERNAEIISRVERNGKEIKVVAWRSFRGTTTKQAYRYTNERFGMAEGLAMDAERVYLILDNNGVARTENEKDVRPMLFVFRR